MTGLEFIIYLIIYLFIGFLFAIVARVILENKESNKSLQEIEVLMILLWIFAIPTILIIKTMSLLIRLVKIIADVIKKKFDI